MKILLLLLLVFTLSNLQGVELTYDRYRNNLRGIRSYEEDDIDSAIEHFERNVINNPGDGQLHFNLGNSFFRRGDFDRAIAEYDRALRDKNFTDSSKAWHNIGNALFEQGEYKDALDMYRNAIITNPDNSDARYNYELTRLLLQEMQNQEQPQSGESESESEQQEQMPAEETDDQDGEDGEMAEMKEEEDGDGDDEREQDQDNRQDLQDAENIMRTLLARERELLEEEQKRAREEMELKGKFW